MRNKFLNSILIILILAFSVLCGFTYDHLFTKYQMHEYPRQYNDTVVACYYEYAVPVSVVYSAIKIESDYDSALLSDEGEIGLMQLTRAEYDILSAEISKKIDSGLLFEPQTNIEIGTYKIAKLFEKYQHWRAVYAALYAGEYTVDSWLRDADYIDESGNLLIIPDRDTEKYVKKFEKTVDIYRELYESAN